MGMNVTWISTKPASTIALSRSVRFCRFWVEKSPPVDCMTVPVSGRLR